MRLTLILNQEAESGCGIGIVETEQQAGLAPECAAGRAQLAAGGRAELLLVIVECLLTRQRRCRVA
jgi:hypothetical protein